VNVSMCAPFLLQIAKQADVELRTPQQSSHHTVREATGDIQKMVDHLLEHRVTTEHRKEGAPFSNPVTKGAEKVAGGIIEKHINNTEESETVTETVPESDEIDISYELHDIT